MLSFLLEQFAPVGRIYVALNKLALFSTRYEVLTDSAVIAASMTGAIVDTGFGNFFRHKLELGRGIEPRSQDYKSCALPLC